MRSASIPLAGYLCLSTFACERCTNFDPVTTGVFDGDTFKPTSGCWHGIPEVDDTFALLAGSWLFTSAGSNGWATHTALVNRLAPSYYAWREERTVEKPLFTDLVSSPRPHSSHGISALHATRVSGHQIFERQADDWVLVYDSFVCASNVCDGETSNWHTTDLNEARYSPDTPFPTHSANHVRVTYAWARLYPETSTEIEYIKNVRALSPFHAFFFLLL